MKLIICHDNLSAGYEIVRRLLKAILNFECSILNYISSWLTADNIDCGLEAVLFKAKYPLSYADAFAAAMSHLQKGIRLALGVTSRRSN